jgi:hypothetical protein
MIVIVGIIYVIYYSIELPASDSYTIEDHGLTVWRTHQHLDNLNPVQKRDALRGEILHRLPPGYQLLDYYYYIKGCSLSTFHRDVTSGQRYFGTIHPTYTVVIYEYDGDFLSVCPNSARTYPFSWSRAINLKGQKNTVVLFNADTVHCGMINKIGTARKVLQYKVAHRDDVEKLRELNDIKVEKTTSCSLSPPVEKSLRLLSWHFCWLINTVFTPLLQRRTSSGISRYVQDAIPISFYNNT